MNRLTTSSDAPSGVRAASGAARLAVNDLCGDLLIHIPTGFGKTEAFEIRGRSRIRKDPQPRGSADEGAHDGRD
jgi:hypothetical protein